MMASVRSAAFTTRQDPEVAPPELVAEEAERQRDDQPAGKAADRVR
jgi:hypothetical protein